MARPRKRSGAATIVDEDCLWVYERLGTAVTPEEAGPRRFELHQWASDPGNRKEFLKNFALPAQERLAAANRIEGDSELVKEEKRTIAKLQAILDNSVQESQMPVPKIENLLL